MAITRLHLTAGDSVGWAIDEDMRLVRESLAGVCEITSLARAQAVHCGWWVNLLPYSRADFRGKHVICSAENPPYYYVTLPEFLKARDLVTTWIARSREAAAQFSALGIESRYAPYTFDPAIFHPLPKDHPEVAALRQKWRIPTDRYLIANFHRDTEGADLQSPKLQKGPDLFLEIVARLHQEGAPVHALLAGPRRFWLRRQLAERGVPFSFVGEDTQGREDLAVNTLPRTMLNVLYSLGDLHLVTSRWEGGPQSVLESAATRSPILSTAVGLAHEVLAPECLFTSVRQACELVRSDIATGFLRGFVEAHYQRVQEHHTEPVLRAHLAAIYGSLAPLEQRSGAMLRGLRRLAARARRLLLRPAPVRTVAILHRPAPEPGTAFDRFFAALAEELGRRGCRVRRDLEERSDACVLGHLPPDDALRPTLETLHDMPVIAFLDDAAPDRASRACTLFPSLDALLHVHREGNLPPRALVFTPPMTAVPGETPPAADDVCVVAENDPWAAGRIEQAMSRGVPVVYPRDSEYRSVVWFGGLPYGNAAEREDRLAEVRAEYATYQRMAVPASLATVADRLLRLIPICRELASHDDAG